MNNSELKKIVGGQITGTFLNAIARVLETIIDIGRSFGSALNYFKNKKSC